MRTINLEIENNNNITYCVCIRIFIFVPMFTPTTMYACFHATNSEKRFLVLLEYLNNMHICISEGTQLTDNVM